MHNVHLMRSGAYLITQLSSSGVCRMDVNHQRYQRRLNGREKLAYEDDGFMASSTTSGMMTMAAANA